MEKEDAAVAVLLDVLEQPCRGQGPRAMQEFALRQAWRQGYLDRATERLLRPGGVPFSELPAIEGIDSWPESVLAKIERAEKSRRRG